MQDQDNRTDEDREIADAMLTEYNQMEAASLRPASAETLVKVGGADADLQPLYRYVRLRNRLVGELARLKESTAKMIRSAEKSIEGLDWVKRPEMEHIAATSLAGGKRRSVVTPWGTVGFRKQAARLVMNDFDTVLGLIARDKLPANIKRTVTSVSVDKQALNEHFESTGEVPDGCTLQPAKDTFYVK